MELELEVEYRGDESQMGARKHSAHWRNVGTGLTGQVGDAAPTSPSLELSLGGGV